MPDVGDFGIFLNPSPDAAPKGMFAQLVVPASRVAPSYLQGLLTHIGSDNRERREDTHNPWLNMICQIEASIDGVIAMRGTGFIVGLKNERQVLVTAAHVLRQRDFTGIERRATGACIRPGRNGSKAPYGDYVVTDADWAIHPDWWPGQAVAHDIAVIQLKSRVKPDGNVPGADPPGYFGVGALVDKALEKRFINVAGYPDVVGQQPANCSYLYWHSDVIVDVEHDRLLHLVDTSEGQSGAPAVLMPVEGHPFTGPLVVGVHTRGADGKGRNAATRITPDILQWVRSYL